MGIVSAIGRNVGIVGEGQGYEDFIQTDAPINPGNSGGALINTAGQLLGINTAILSGSGGNQGIGFAIPANLAREVMDQLIKSGKVTRSYIGVGIQEVTPSLAEAFKAPIGSVAITQVEPDAPGSRAGLEVGDIIVGIDGEEVRDSNQFRLRVSRTAPGTAVKLRINRAGETREVPVTLAARPGTEAGERGATAPGGDERSPLEGVDVEALTPAIARELQLPAGTRGVVVSDVDARSAAGEAGLQRGDIIQQVNRKPVATVAEFNSAVRASAGQRSVVLLVNRGGASVFVAIENRAPQQ
jgi:S1-C subfamily serine protease